MSCHRLIIKLNKEPKKKKFDREGVGAHLLSRLRNSARRSVGPVLLSVSRPDSRRRLSAAASTSARRSPSPASGRASSNRDALLSRRPCPPDPRPSFHPPGASIALPPRPAPSSRRRNPPPPAPLGLRRPRSSSCPPLCPPPWPRPRDLSCPPWSNMPRRPSSGRPCPRMSAGMLNRRPMCPRPSRP